jgi:hypothetical protein
MRRTGPLAVDDLVEIVRIADVGRGHSWHRNASSDDVGCFSHRHQMHQTRIGMRMRGVKFASSPKSSWVVVTLCLFRAFRRFRAECGKLRAPRKEVRGDLIGELSRFRRRDCGKQIVNCLNILCCTTTENGFSAVKRHCGAATGTGEACRSSSKSSFPWSSSGSL